MAKVASTNLISEPRNNVVSLISNKSNVADPITSSSEYRKWIYSRDPDIKAADFAGYPFIVINPATIDTSNGASLDMTRRFVDWTIEIEVVSSDRGQGNRAGKGLTHNDAITDDILETLLKVANRKTLISQGMSLNTPIISDVLIEPLKHELTYRRIITVPFDGNWTQTSA
jgi:hypothetical protein